MSIVITVISGAHDHDVPDSVDGIRCDSCGSECSVMCGSRNFRACCYNYIKKRSVPWPGTGGSNGATGENMEDENQDNKSSNQLAGDLKPSTLGTSNSVKSPLLVPHQQGMGTGKHFFRGGYIPEIVGGDSIEEGTILYPMSLRDLMLRTLNAYESKKIGRIIF